MSRKKEATWETEKEHFPSTLRKLMNDRKVTQRELADAIGMRPQTVSLYVTGQSAPDINCLKKIAEFFNVSSDYLLGLSDITTNNADIQAACVTTGLSESAIVWLQTVDTTYLQLLNTLLENEELANLLLSSMYLYAMSAFTHVKFIDNLTGNERNFDLSESEALIKYEAQDSFSIVLDKLRSIYSPHAMKMMEDQIRFYKLKLEGIENGQHHKDD